jgi:hypothetical protein
MNLRKPFLITFAVTLGLLAATGVLAWTGPSASPPSGNASAPVNISATAQIKNGAFTATSLGAPTICIGADCRGVWPSGGTSQWTTSGTAIYYNSGNVGIGTSAALPALFGIQAGANNSGTTFYINNRTRNDAQLAVYVAASVASGDFAITTAGSVGIGNTTPGLPLEVKAPHAGGPATSGATQTGGLRLSQGDGGAVLDTGINATGAGWLQATVSTNLASVLPLLLNPNGGNVGIGQTSPNARFDVSSNGGSDGLVIKQAIDNTEDIQTYIDSQYAARTTYASGCCNQLRLNPDIGDVLIAGNITATHAGTLTVPSTLIANGGISATGVITASGQVTGSDVCTAAGKCLSTVPASGTVFGGGFGQFPAGGCANPNFITGSPTCSCPIAGTTAHGLVGANTNSGTVNVYLCY